MKNISTMYRLAKHKKQVYTNKFFFTNEPRAQFITDVLFPRCKIYIFFIPLEELFRAIPNYAAPDSFICFLSFSSLLLWTR